MLQKIREQSLNDRQRLDREITPRLREIENQATESQKLQIKKARLDGAASQLPRLIDSEKGLKSKLKIAEAEKGKLKLNDEVEIVGIKPTQKCVVTGIEMFNKQLDESIAGDNDGLLLRGVKKEDVTRGQVLAKPGSITPHTEFESEVYILSKEEGGRHTPFFKGYKPQFYIRTTDVTGEVELPEGTEMVMPGDNVAMEVELIQPVAVEEGMRFAIREGGRTVGAGVVATIIT